MFGVFLAAVAFFHLSEFALAFTYTRHEVSCRSFLISRQYLMAMAVACMEFLVESFLVPSLKTLRTIQMLGLALVILGEAIRKAAYVTARHNFTHDIKHERRPNHQLVTRGIYRYVRHPGYMGWFIWAVATQIMLCNPISTVLFALVSWRFFDDRILYEERLLVQFFGRDYITYAASVPSGIPFVP
eukprot:jgi/Mesen1/5581/ME000281S04636